MRSTRSAWFLPSLLAAACYAPPQTVEESRQPAEKSDDLFHIQNDYWERQDLPTLKGKGIKTVCVSEFSLEFVLSKYRLPGPGGSRVLDAFDTFRFPTQAFGLGVRLAEFPTRLMHDLPGELYQAFVRGLESKGVKVIPIEQVRQAKAYARYQTTHVAESSFFRHLNPVGTDLGRVRHTKTWPAEGLRVIEGAKEGEPETVDAALLEETRADVVVRARFRVGEFEGKASIESGSVVLVTGRDYMGTMLSSRSLISDGPVVEEDARPLLDEGFMPLRGFLYPIDPDRYRAAIGPLFQRYLELAFDRL